jgi:Flp pilus assembly protein TadG
MGIVMPPSGRRWRLKRLTRAGRRSERGVTLVEFALVALPFFILLFGIFEVGFVFWGTYELENATEDAARLIRTGQVHAAGKDGDASYFKTQICNRVSLLVDCTAKLRVEVQDYDSFTSLNPPSPLDGDHNLKGDDGFAYSPGGPERVVLVTSFYEWPLLNILSSMSLSNMASGNRLLRASAAFRNEPFPE